MKAAAKRSWISWAATTHYLMFKDKDTGLPGTRSLRDAVHYFNLLSRNDGLPPVKARSREVRYWLWWCKRA